MVLEVGDVEDVVLVLDVPPGPEPRSLTHEPADAPPNAAPQRRWRWGELLHGSPY